MKSVLRPNNWAPKKKPEKWRPKQIGSYETVMYGQKVTVRVFEPAWAQGGSLQTLGRISNRGRPSEMTFAENDETESETVV